MCMCTQKKIVLSISVSHQMYVCGGCDKVHAHKCVCLYAEKWRKRSLMFECGCVSLLACICVFVKDTVYVKGKKNTALWLSSDILKAGKPRTEKVL